MLIWTIIAAAIVAVDQLAKIIVMYNIGPTDCIHIIPKVINLVYVKNTGAAFSILSDNTAFLSALSILFCIGVCIFWYIKRPKDKLLCTSLSMFFAGALGNAIDRIFRGFVVDFISTAFVKFPVFNIADIAITCGAVLLIIYMLFFDKDDEDGKADASGKKNE